MWEVLLTSHISRFGVKMIFAKLKDRIPLANLKITLAIIVIGSTFCLFAAILCTELNQNNREVVMYMLGVLNTLSTLVLSFYFGSSDGSEKKTDFLQKSMDKQDNKGT